MRSLSGVGLGLSLVFGCLLLALLAELYYLLWWKKRIIHHHRHRSEVEEEEEEDDDHQFSSSSSPAREFLYMFCWKKPSSLSSTALNPQHLCPPIPPQNPNPNLHSQSAPPNKDFWFKPFGEGEEEDSTVEGELMRLHGISGPPRFLFTIKEETKEDLESDHHQDGRSRGRSLSDLVLTVETPFLTPLASPSFFTTSTPPPMDSSSSPSSSSSSYTQNGFNPLFESASDAEFNRVKSSPPPRFKFLRDAEDKLQRKQRINGDCKAPPSSSSSSSVIVKDEEESGSFITLIVAKNREREVVNHHSSSSSSSQVLPLASSPPTYRPLSNNKPISH